MISGARDSDIERERERETGREEGELRFQGG